MFSESLGRVSAVWVVGFDVAPALGIRFGIRAALGVGLDVEGEGSEKDGKVSGDCFVQLVPIFGFLMMPRGARKDWTARSHSLFVDERA
ncbi:hypothetical protein PTE31013_04662 [Pandoraea terrigena]|uniref:Uncharacterized protein n=1 Tax=Pandoraea terrigena TaxID=2508292 RepID=A0A5E4YNP5_9BURK|nr:hypothetical protein PTE31013_04662 [Pandoraea terrigena]